MEHEYEDKEDATIITGRVQDHSAERKDGRFVSDDYGEIIKTEQGHSPDPGFAEEGSFPFE